MTKEEQAGAALERLILSLLDDPRAAAIEVVALPSRLNVRVRVTADDAGKVIGKKGAHVNALKLVAARMGDRLGQVWDLKVLDPEDGPRAAATPRPTPARGAYSPAADLHLLAEVVGLCTAQTYVFDYAPGAGGADWTFRVTPRDWPAHEALVDKGGLDDGDTLVGALGTLFRAVGRRQGVGYVVEVAK